MTPAPLIPFDDSQPLPAEEFDALLIAVLPRLRGYVAALVGGWNAVDDIVQEVSIVLIQKRETFEPNSNFAAWAFRVDYFKATTWRRDRQREGRVMFSETFFQSAAAIAEEHFAERPHVDEALAHCLDKLPPQDRELIRLKYGERVSLTSQAAASDRKSNTLHKAV